jgi:hypothetical protein
VPTWFPSDGFVAKFDHVGRPLAGQVVMYAQKGEFLFGEHRGAIVGGTLGRPPAEGAMDGDESAALEATADLLVRAVQQEAHHTPEQQLGAMRAYKKQFNPEAPLRACGACGLANF